MKHQYKDVQKAINAVVEKYGRVETEGGNHTHSWLKCKYYGNKEKCKACFLGQKCKIAVFCTPEKPQNHANQIIQQAKNCIYEVQDAEESGDENVH